MTKPERTPEAYRRDLYRARLVICQLRDEVMDSGEPFQVGGQALDAAAPDALWDGLNRVDTHFWHEESLEGSGATTPSPRSTPRGLVEVRG